jgi:hypothetical protein
MLEKSWKIRIWNRLILIHCEDLNLLYLLFWQAIFVNMVSKRKWILGLSYLVATRVTIIKQVNYKRHFVQLYTSLIY